MITVSHSKVTKLAANEDYFGDLDPGFYKFKLFKITNPNKRITKINFAQCVGQSRFAVVKDPSHLSEPFTMTSSEEHGMKIGILHNLPAESYLLVEALS